MTENLPRVTQKIFGGNTETNIGQFGSAKNGSPTRTGDIEQIQALSAWGEGWNAAVIGERDYPALEEMTGVQKVFSQQLAYYFQKGFPEWDAATTYFKNVSFCQLDGIVYQSLTDNNLGNNPSTDSANWTKWNPAGGTFANTDLSNLSQTGQDILDSKLDDSRISNCILGVTNGLITVNNYSDAAYVNKDCDIAQNVASGFGAAAYILLNKTFTDAVNFTFEIPFKLNTTAGTQYIARINNDKNGFGVQDGVLFLTYDGEQETGTIQLQPNIDYVIKLERNSSTKTYTLALKTTGDYTTHITLNSPSGYYADKSVFLGGGSANYLNGTINLANVQITADSASYWTLTSAADFQTVTVSGQYDLLMPDGLNLDKTLNNQNLTISVNQELLYSPGGTKTVLIKNDGEVMIRDGYVISGTEPQNLALSGVWYDNVNNVMQEQSILYANLQLVNPSGDAPAITDGVLNITTDGQYADLAGTADLGQNWNITLNLTSEPSSDGGFIIGAASVSDNSVMPDGIALQYNEGNITAYFRRNDVSVVEKVTVLSTAYIVSKDSGSTTGYVQTEGSEGEYVAAETPVYSDQTFETLLENAPADTWTYSGNSVNNTQTTTGYVKAAGEGTFVPPSTQVYTDANCTSEQAVATGTDYTYTGSSAASVIGSLTTTYSDTITMGFNGTQYTLGAQTLSSTDVIRQGCNITLGGAAGVSSAITGINLNTSVFSFWTWNGSTIETPDFIPFVGAKVGTITDNGQTIVSTKIDNPVVLANSDLSNLSDEGEKHFLNKSQITNCILEAPNGVITYSGNTITIKKGLKVLIPDGRNADGTLKNIEYTLQDDIVFDNVTYPDEMNIFLQYPGKSNLYSNKVTFQVKTLGERPNINGDDKYACVYVEETNLWYQKNVSLNQYVELKLCPLGVVSTNGTTTTSVTLYNTLSVLNKNDTEFIANQAMPGDKYINLSLKASEDPYGYVAPTDGYFILSYRLNNGNTRIAFTIVDKEGVQTLGSKWLNENIAGTVATGFLPVSKGQKIIIVYNPGVLLYFRFIYAQGVQ